MASSAQIKPKVSPITSELDEAAEKKTSKQVVNRGHNIDVTEAPPAVEKEPLPLKTSKQIVAHSLSVTNEKESDMDLTDEDEDEWGNKTTDDPVEMASSARI